MVWIIVMFLSAVWTLILTAPIHYRASISNAISLQILWRNELIYILNGQRTSSTFSAHVHFWLNFPLKNVYTKYHLIRIVINTGVCYNVLFFTHFSTDSQIKSSNTDMQFIRFPSKKHTPLTHFSIQIQKHNNSNDITCLCLFLTSPKSHAFGEPSQALHNSFQMKSFSAV